MSINWLSIGIEIGRLLVFLLLSGAVTFYLVTTVLPPLIEQQLPAMAKSVLSMDEKQMQQIQSVKARTGKQAASLVATDLMENTPLSYIVSIFSEKTKEYLNEHPEALPEVLSSYMPVIEVGTEVLPYLAKFLEERGNPLSKKDRELFLS